MAVWIGEASKPGSNSRRLWPVSGIACGAGLLDVVAFGQAVAGCGAFESFVGTIAATTETGVGGGGAGFDWFGS